MRSSKIVVLVLAAFAAAACGGGGGGNVDASADDPDGSTGQPDGGPTESGPRIVYLQSDQPPDDNTGDVTMVRLLSQPVGDEVDPTAADRLFDGFVLWEEHEPKLLPRVSPDGTMIAFLDDVEHDLYVAPVDGSAAATRLTDPGIWVSSFSWSPDSSWIFVDETANLHVIAPDGSGTKYLTWPAGATGTVEDARWAKDSSRIVLRTYSSGSHILVVTPGQMDVVDLTPTGVVDFGFAVSADGSRVAYSVDGNVHVANPDGSGAVLVSTGDSVTGSPAGDRIVYRDGDSDVESVGFDGMNPVTVHTGGDYVGPIFYWAPDSSRFLYQQDSQTDGYRLATPDGALNVTVHAQGPSHESAHKWAPDSANIAFSVADFSGDGGGNHLYTATASDGVATPVARGFGLDWLAAGVVYHTGVDESDQEFVDVVRVGPTTAGEIAESLKPVVIANMPANHKFRRVVCGEISTGTGYRWICRIIIQERVAPGSPYTTGPEKYLQFSRPNDGQSEDWKFDHSKTMGFFDFYVEKL